jgi:2-iminoacetate synthase
MTYLDGMEESDPVVMNTVLKAAAAYDPASYTEADVRRALDAPVCAVENFGALLSPAAAPFLEEMAQRARTETRRHVGH